MAKILIFESSTEVCSVALSENGKIIGLKEDKGGQSHAKLLTAFAHEILVENRINGSEIDAVAVSKGPGSYTGLRIGVSAAKGFCFAHGLPLIAISSLEAMTDHVRKNRNNLLPGFDGDVLYCPMMDARRMEVYTAMYDQQGREIKSVSAKVVDSQSFVGNLEKSNLIFFGNGASKCKDVIKHENAYFIDDIYTSAQYMIELAHVAYNEELFEDIAYFEPFYLKNFVAIKAKNTVLGR